MARNCPVTESYSWKVVVVTVVRLSGSLNSAVTAALSGTPVDPLAGLNLRRDGARHIDVRHREAACDRQDSVPVVITTSRGPSVAAASIVMLFVNVVAELTSFEFTVIPAP